MKRFLAITCAATLAVSAALSFAGEKVGVVNMEAIFKSAPQVQKINQDLQKQFAGKKETIMSQGKNLQAEYDKYNKNKSVMSKADSAKLRDQISKKEMGLRQAQADFQKDLFTAQNKAMGDFMAQVNKIVSGLAKKNDMDVVVPSNAVIYSDPSLDITSQVLDQLK